MENFRFEEELLREGYQFFANNKGNGAYVLIKSGNIEDDHVVDFKVIEDYFNIREKLTKDKYLLVFYDKISKVYKVMIVNEKWIIRYPLLAKFFCKNKVAAVEVQGILSILNTKLRQEKWYNYEIEHTLTEDIQTLILAKTDKKSKN